MLIPEGLLLPLNRAPTLSYTKQLETRVAQLEDALSRARSQPSSSEAELRKAGSPASTGGSSTSAAGGGGVLHRMKDEENASEQDLAQDFEGLQVENDGRISFHGPTSLFQLPGGAVPEASGASSQLAMGIGARKERLINNAWRERAFEQLAAMPVGSLLLY